MVMLLHSGWYSQSYLDALHVNSSELYIVAWIGSAVAFEDWRHSQNPNLARMRSKALANNVATMACYFERSTA